MPPNEKTPEQKADEQLDAARVEQQLAEARKRTAASTKEARAANIAYLESLESVAAANLEVGRTAGLQGEELDDLVSKHTAAANAVKETTKAQEDLNTAFDKGEEVGTTFLAMFGLMGDQFKNTTTGALTSAEGIKGLGKSFLTAIEPMNLVNSALNAFVEGSISLTMAADDARVALNKETGMANHFSDSMSRNEEVLRAHGVTTGDLAELHGALARNLGTFTELSDAQADQIVQSTAILDRYGISNEATSENIGVMSAAMGMSAVAAAETQNAMFLFAQQNNIASKQMFSDFEQNRGTLMRFGADAVDVFQGLAIAAKKSNMQVGQLISIAEQFDRFDSAAESVGRLNALLGGPFLNTLEMVTSTDPLERLQMLQDGLINAGKGFDDMSYYERQAIADAMGLKDVGELALVMSGNFDGLAEGANKTQAEYEELARQSQEFSSVMEEMKQLLMSLASEFKPVILWMKKMMQAFQEMSPFTKKFIVWTAVLIKAIPLLKAFFGLFKLGKMLSIAMAPIKALLAFLTLEQAAADTLQTASMTAKIPIMRAATKVMAQMVPTALGLGFAVLMAAGGLALMFAAIAMGDPGTILAAAFALGVLAVAIWALAGPLTALGAFIMTGVGAAVFAFIIAGFAAVMFSMSLFVASVGLVVGAAAFMFKAMGGALEALAAMDGKNFLVAASGVAVLAAALAALPVIKMIAISTVFDNAAAYEASAAMREAAMAKGAAGTNVNVTTGATTVQSAPQTIVLDGRKVGESRSFNASRDKHFGRSISVA